MILIQVSTNKIKMVKSQACSDVKPTSIISTNSSNVLHCLSIRSRLSLAQYGRRRKFVITPRKSKE